jgi:hypothetical protein
MLALKNTARAPLKITAGKLDIVEKVLSNTYHRERLMICVE